MKKAPIGHTIKKIREEKTLTQQQIADLIHMHRSNYSKVESGKCELPIEVLDKIARLFGMTIDKVVNFEGDLPVEVTVEDKTLLEQVKMIQDLEPDERTMIFKMIDTFLTKKKFKDFFQKNIATM